ncbi:hypothetical protein V6N13_086969 [Hibiscus sabdariffa]
MAFPYMEAVVGFMILMYLFETYLDLRQHAALKLPTLPRTLEGVISQEKFEKSRAYSLDKSLAYLHEGLEPKVSDFGLAKLLCTEWTYVTTRVMGTYVPPEYACTGMLNEKSDVYSFGVLTMEIISGRSPVDYNQKSKEVIDPKQPHMPASKALKRILLVALRCVDPDAMKRPKMEHVIHMLESDELLFQDVGTISHILHT